MPIKTTEITLSFSPKEIEKLIIEYLVKEGQLKSDKDVSVYFEVGEDKTNADPMDRYPGPTIVKNVVVKSRGN